MAFYWVTDGDRSAKKKDPNDNRGVTPFFLRDPRDEMCLGQNGFTACTEQVLWILTRRPGKKTYSLVSLLTPSHNGLCLEAFIPYYIPLLPHLKPHSFHPTPILYRGKERFLDLLVLIKLVWVLVQKLVQNLGILVCEIRFSNSVLM